jgi:hypothetical protein
LPGFLGIARETGNAKASALNARSHSYRYIYNSYKREKMKAGDANHDPASRQAKQFKAKPAAASAIASNETAHVLAMEMLTRFIDVSRINRKRASSSDYANQKVDSC